MKRRNIGGGIKWAIIVAGTVVLFLLVRGATLRERGYPAIGGEGLVLIIPIIYYAVERTVKDWVADIKTVFRERERSE